MWKIISKRREEQNYQQKLTTLLRGVQVMMNVSLQHTGYVYCLIMESIYCLLTSQSADYQRINFISFVSEQNVHVVVCFSMY